MYGHFDWAILLCYNIGSNVIMNIWKFQKCISTSIPDKQNGASTVGQNLLAEKIDFKVAAGTESLASLSASHLSRLSSYEYINVIMNIWKFQKCISTSIPDKQNGASTVGQNLLAEKIDFKVAAGTESLASLSASHLSRLSSFIHATFMHRCQLRGFVPNPTLYSTRLWDIARYVR